MSGQRRIRIGIDVGGTFTHAVAVDAGRARIISKCKVPTTHRAAEGVARGVADSLMTLLTSANIAPDDVALIAHSTTQATNALLEGDVATVGIIGMGEGASAAFARVQTRIRPIRLTPTRNLQTSHRFLSVARLSEGAIKNAISELRTAGAEVIVAAGAFSVDDPRHERLVCKVAERVGLSATATHEISQLHGLGLRTRTAVINASMIPKMLATANMTEEAVRSAGIAAPVMIMRSDGGVMSIAEMRRRPILTMLSGPAAGVAASLLYARVSDGVFIDVGGTSTDISAIKNGRTQVRGAVIGGNRLHVSTLDVRTIGVAGGSLVGVRDGAITQIGPRSAHIAGLPYLSFCEHPPEELAVGTLKRDGETYLTVRSGDEHIAITPTCASNALGLVHNGDPARGPEAVITAGLDRAATSVGMSDGAALSRAVLDHASAKAVQVIERLIHDYRLERGVLRLVAGGGGGSAIVPYVAERMGLSYEPVEHADVISAIGVALALVRDSVERTVIQPGPQDIRRIREEVMQRLLQMGAAADTIEVFVEVDGRRNMLRATAEGALELREQAPVTTLSETERRTLVTASFGAADANIEMSGRTRGFEVWTAHRPVRRLFGLFTERRLAARVLDVRGTIRWSSNHSAVRETRVAEAVRELAAFAEDHTRYSDAGATIPRCFVALAQRIADLSGLAEMAQVTGLLQEEIAHEPPDDACVLLLQLGSNQ